LRASKFHTVRANDRHMSQSTDFFGQQAAGWSDLYVTDAQFERRYGLITELMTRVLAGREAGRALDLGCGSGVFAALLADFGWEVVAVDKSAAMLHAAKSYCSSQLGERIAAVEFREMRIEALDLEAGSFDLVVCLSVLEYVEDDRTALESMATVLRPNGFLVLTVPNRRGLARRVESLVHRVRWPGTGYLRYQHHQYVPEEIDGALRHLGFEKVGQRFWSVGFSRMQVLVAALERWWWAGMYGAVYVKRRR
jgi:2-polyprenyl-3-methyl-5-hydroxy-6-metoxy-1,4-benzoquinol methylase